MPPPDRRYDRLVLRPSEASHAKRSKSTVSSTQLASIQPGVYRVKGMILNLGLGSRRVRPNTSDDFTAKLDCGGGTTVANISNAQIHNVMCLRGVILILMNITGSLGCHCSHALYSSHKMGLVVNKVTHYNLASSCQYGSPMIRSE